MADVTKDSTNHCLGSVRWVALEGEFAAGRAAAATRGDDRN